MKKVLEWVGSWLPTVWAWMALIAITACLLGLSISAVLWIISLLGGM